MNAAAGLASATEVFYSYSHRDTELRDELERHLSILRRSGLIRCWHDRQIDPGSEWAGKIHEHLNDANIILLLVSADFLASDYCYDVEMKRAMERHEAGEAIVIPIILRPVDWSGAPFAKIQCLPTDGKPVTSWPNRDEAFRNVAEGIRRAIARTTRLLGTEVQERALDAAIRSNVLVGSSTEMLTLIRTTTSEGLKAVLRIEDAHDATVADVQSKPFRMEFLRNDGGELVAHVLTIRVESNDFDVAQPIKQISVAPDGDSETCSFLVTPRRAGHLALVVEVLHEGISVASRLLRTTGEETPQFEWSGTYRLASLPLMIYAHKERKISGDFTRMFGGRPQVTSVSEPVEGPPDFTHVSEAPSPVMPQPQCIRPDVPHSDAGTGFGEENQPQIQPRLPNDPPPTSAKRSYRLVLPAITLIAAVVVLLIYLLRC